MLIITEVVYLIGTRLGPEPEIRFLGDLAAGNLIAEPVLASDWSVSSSPGLPGPASRRRGRLRGGPPPNGSTSVSS
jgi:hypothetical protein